MIKKIYIDMDGVLADFDKMKELIAKDRPEILDDKEGLWEVVNSIEHFYYDLPLCPWANELMGFLQYLDVPLCILTALPRRREIKNAEPDKRLWVKDFVDRNIEFRIGPYAIDKQNHCQGPGDVLIDDNAQNIAQWNAKGGHGILFTGDIQACFRQVSALS